MYAIGRPYRVAPGRRRFRPKGTVRADCQRTNKVVRQTAVGAGLAVCLPLAVRIAPRQAAFCSGPEGAVRPRKSTHEQSRPASRRWCWPCCRSASGRPCRASPGHCYQFRPRGSRRKSSVNTRTNRSAGRRWCWPGCRSAIARLCRAEPGRPRVPAQREPSRPSVNLKTWSSGRPPLVLSLL